MALRVLVLHGPNVSFSLPPGHTLERLDRQLVSQGRSNGLEVRTFQANGEAPLLDELMRQRPWAQAVVVNPGSLAPTAWALADALEGLGLPAVEVLLTPLAKGRGKSALEPVVTKQFHGLGEAGYTKALQSLTGTSKRAAVARPGARGAAKKKTIGRRTSEPLAKSMAPRRAKTIGKRVVAEVMAASPAPMSKSIGRRAAAAALAEADGLRPPVMSNGLSRAGVRGKVKDRLAGRLSAEALAAWARAQWLVVTSGGAVENGHGDTLEQVLLSLASPKASDDTLLAAMARLDT